MRTIGAQPEPLLIVGTGSWGTALAVSQGAHRDVVLLCRSPEERARLEHARSNESYLPAVPFPARLRLEVEVEAACAQSKVVVVVVPSSRMRENARRLAPFIGDDHVVVSGAKGLEAERLLRMTEVLAEEFRPEAGRNVGALSGPNIAREVAAGKPATSVVASTSEYTRALAVGALTTPQFRVYANLDVVGVELGGALKNIVAIGAGAIDGLGAGDNAKAAFVTRGLAEIARLGVASGANPLTFAGLAGLGDLLATVSSPSSRNRFVGQEFARGRSLDDIRATLAPQVAEGVETTRAVYELAAKLGVRMPVVEQTYLVLFEGKTVALALADLMLREPKDEFDL